MAFRVFKERNIEFGKFFGGFKFVGPLALLTLLMMIIYMLHMQHKVHVIQLRNILIYYLMVFYLK